MIVALLNSDSGEVVWTASLSRMIRLPISG